MTWGLEEMVFCEVGCKKEKGALGGWQAWGGCGGSAGKCRFFGLELGLRREFAEISNSLFCVWLVFYVLARTVCLRIGFSTSVLPPRLS